MLSVNYNILPFICILCGWDVSHISQCCLCSGGAAVNTCQHVVGFLLPIGYIILCMEIKLGVNVWDAMFCVTQDGLLLTLPWQMWLYTPNCTVFDHISLCSCRSIGIYLDTVNIFIRILSILMSSNSRKKR